MSTPMNIQHHRRSSMSFYAPQPTHARSFSNQLGTSWSDGFEFDSCSPLTSALHFGTSPSAYNAYMTSSCAPFTIPSSPPRDYFTFERDYCSNFACCGITLPDMHALVAHFEESHLGGADGMPFMAHHHSPGQGIGISSQPRAAPHVATNAEFGMNVSPNTAVGDAPSPHSSVGPETPPPVSHVAGYPHLQIQTQVYGCRSNSGSPYPNSPYSSSGSSGNSEGSGSHSSSSIGEMDVDVDMDILMSFDPLDSAAHTPLDSTPPSPLAHPIRPNSVLRSAVLKNSGGQPDAPPVCLPPALFSAPPHGPSPLGLNKDGSLLKKEKKEKRSRPEGLTVATSEASGAFGSAGGAVRREKNRKAASSAMGSLLGLGATSSRSSISSSSDEDLASGASTKAEKGQEKKLEEKPEKAHRERAERTGRPERPDKSGKRTREKAYKCPKPGCTKSYLNPNGLKYHTLKGTCTFLNGSGPLTPVTPTTPSIPSITVPSAPPLAALSPSSSQYASDVSSLPTASQPLTPISMPSSPVVNSTHQAYEYANHHQVQILPEVAPREGAPQAYMYAPAQMC